MPETRDHVAVSPDAELVERVARALIRQYGFAPHIEPDTLFWNAMALAVIPLIRQAVIEECAKVANSLSEREDRSAAELFRKPGEWKHRHASDVAEEIAIALRALKP